MLSKRTKARIGQNKIHRQLPAWQHRWSSYTRAVNLIVDNISEMEALLLPLDEKTSQGIRDALVQRLLDVSLKGIMEDHGHRLLKEYEKAFYEIIPSLVQHLRNTKAYLYANPCFSMLLRPGDDRYGEGLMNAPSIDAEDFSSSGDFVVSKVAVNVDEFIAFMKATYPKDEPLHVIQVGIDPRTLRVDPREVEIAYYESIE